MNNISALLPKPQPSFKRIFFLGDDWFHDMSVDIGQPEVASLVFEGQSFVVDTQQVKNGRMEIMYVNAVFGDIV